VVWEVVVVVCVSSVWVGRRVTSACVRGVVCLTVPTYDGVVGGTAGCPCECVRVVLSRMGEWYGKWWL
jgi:hypothetical protein